MSLPDSTHSTMSLPDSTSLYYDRLKYSYIQIILMIHQMLDFKLIQFHYIPESSRDKAAQILGEDAAQFLNRLLRPWQCTCVSLPCKIQTAT